MQSQPQPIIERQESTHAAGMFRSAPLWSGSLLWWALVILVFIAGIGLRVYDLDDPPLDFHPTRQIHSYLIARGIYLQDNPAFPQWQRDRALTQWKMEGQIEPLLMERLSVTGYRLAGGEQLWIPRALSILFWLLAGLFLFLTCLRVIGHDGALVALGFFLIWPYGVVASRSFQPDPLMVALIAAAWWAADRWQASRERSPDARTAWMWALAAGLLAGLAIYVKTVAVFLSVPLLAVYTVRGGAQFRLIRVLRDRQAWLIAVLAVLPAAIYYFDGLVLRGYLVQQMGMRFFPEMWLDPAFYLRWVGEIDNTVSFEAALVALLGVFLITAPLHRAVLIALWAGYTAYGLALPHHIGTHDYYQLPLFLLTAVGLGAAGGLALRHMRGPRLLASLGAAGILLAGLTITGYEARNTLKRSDYRAQAALWQQVGAKLGPEASVTALVDDYGVALSYWGWIIPGVWPTAADIRWQAENGQEMDFSQRFTALAEGREYFIVSPLDELERQPDLAGALAGYPVVMEMDGMRVYDLRDR